MNPISTEIIRRMPYPDFVGFVNQWNVLPGAYTTLSKWATFSRLDKNSQVIELACTSGFSSRELATLTGCSGVGLDISALSIEMAQHNKKEYAPHIPIEYVRADALTFTPQKKFSHVIIGAALKFFPDPQKVIDRIITAYLVDGGILLASPFYITERIPDDLVEHAKSVFGITITTENYKEIMRLYSGFEILYENRCDTVPETDAELQHYCESTVKRACRIRKIADNEIAYAMHTRLMEIKRMSNDLRPYQKYAVLVLRYRSTVYPYRYAELF